MSTSLNIKEFNLYQPFSQSVVLLINLYALTSILSLSQVSAQKHQPETNTHSSSTATTEQNSAVIKKTPPIKHSLTLTEPVKHCHIGTLSYNLQFSLETPDSYCVKGIYYEGAHYRLGRLNLFHPQTSKKNSISAGTVMISAIKKENLWNQLNKQGACPKREMPIMQFRSDWYADEGGYHTTRENLVAASYLEMQGTQKESVSLNLLKVQQPSILNTKKYNRRKRNSLHITEPVVIQVINPLSVPFNDVKLVLHYEGGSGKPMPYYETIPISLQASEKQIIHVAATIQRVKNKYKPTFVFNSASLKGMIGQCQLH